MRDELEGVNHARTAATMKNENAPMLAEAGDAAYRDRFRDHLQGRLNATSPGRRPFRSGACCVSRAAT